MANEPTDELEDSEAASHSYDADDARVNRNIERTVAVLLALALVVPLLLLEVYPFVPYCDVNRNVHNGRPLVLFLCGAVPAGIAFLAYLLRLGSPNKPRWLHLAGLGALLLTILETSAAALWAFVLGMSCAD